MAFLGDDDRFCSCRPSPSSFPSMTMIQSALLRNGQQNRDDKRRRRLQRQRPERARLASRLQTDDKISPGLPRYATQMPCMHASQSELAELRTWTINNETTTATATSTPTSCDSGFNSTFSPRSTSPMNVITLQATRRVEARIPNARGAEAAENLGCCYRGFSVARRRFKSRRRSRLLGRRGAPENKRATARQCTLAKQLIVPNNDESNKNNNLGKCCDTKREPCERHKSRARQIKTSTPLAQVEVAPMGGHCDRPHANLQAPEQVKSSLCSQKNLSKQKAIGGKLIVDSCSFLLLLSTLILLADFHSTVRLRRVAATKTISIKIGALFEETDFEQSNVFVRTIKMINEGESDAIRQMLGAHKPAETKTTTTTTTMTTTTKTTINRDESLVKQNGELLGANEATWPDSSGQVRAPMSTNGMNSAKNENQAESRQSENNENENGHANANGPTTSRKRRQSEPEGERKENPDSLEATSGPEIRNARLSAHGTPTREHASSSGTDKALAASDDHQDHNKQNFLASMQPRITELPGSNPLSSQQQQQQQGRERSASAISHGGDGGASDATNKAKWISGSRDIELGGVELIAADDKSAPTASDAGQQQRVVFTARTSGPSDLREINPSVAGGLGKNRIASDKNHNQRRVRSRRAVKNKTTTNSTSSLASFSWNPFGARLASADEQISVNATTDVASTNERQSQVKFEPMVEFLSNQDSSFEADKRVCQLIESGVRTLIGPLDGLSIQHVQSICDQMELPYFQLRPYLGSVVGGGSSSSSWLQQPKFARSAPKSSVEARSSEGPDDLSVVIPTSSGGVNEDSIIDSGPDDAIETNDNENKAASATATINDELLTLNLHPPAHLLTSAYIDLIYAWNWTSFAIVYEHESSMIKLQDLFRESSGTWTSRWKIKLFRYRQSNAPTTKTDTTSSDDPSGGQPHKTSQENQNGSQRANLNPEISSESFRDLFWRIKRSGESNVILDLSGPSLNEALKQAQQVGCMTDRFNYLITSLDLHIADLENVKYGRTRITALSLINLDPHLPVSTHDNSMKNYLADESYLEQLGVQISAKSQDYERSRSVLGGSRNKNYATSKNNLNGHWRSNLPPTKFPKFSLSPSIVLDKSGSFMEPSIDAYGGLASQTSANPTQGQNGNKWPMGLGANVARSNHVDMGGLGFGGPGDGGFSPGSPSTQQANHENQHISGFQVPRSASENELFNLLVDQQVEMHNLSRVRLATTSAILHDSLVLLALGLRELDPSGSYLKISDEQSSNGQSDATWSSPTVDDNHHLSCSLGSSPWRYGSSLINYMHRIQFTGLTGPIRFDRRGLRSSFKLNILGVANEIGIVKVGEWHSDLHNQSQSNVIVPSNNHGDDNLLIDELTRDPDDELPEIEAELARVKRRLAALDLNTKLPFKIPYKKSLSRSGALKVNNIIFERLYKEQTDQIDTLIVTTKLSQPYFMLKETPTKLEGNDQYEGFAVDLVHELSRLLNFRYRWREVADKKYGASVTLSNGTKVWNGMIGEIVRGVADLAIVDLTITSEREEAVDFTLPFMNTGISILFKKPTTKMTTLYSFLSPFTRDVWAYVLAAYCGISAILFFVGHLSPYEWADPHPCPHLKAQQADDPDSTMNGGSGSFMDTMLHNQFSLPNSFWFTIGSLMQQGSDLTPRSMSTRTVAGIWYFFTLIMISSYTANLAAFLTVEKVIFPIENVRDLANQQEIRYGCVESGSTCTFFKDSQIDTYKRINETMARFKSYLKSNDEGQKRVEEGKFAFFMESASIEYIVERNCNLTQIGGLLDSKGYGLATSKKSRLKRPYRTLLSEGILHLQETGMLHVLKNRWWKERRGGGTCADDSKGGGVTELSLANVGGVFVVLVGGLCLAFMVAMGEFLWRSKRNGMSRNNLCDHMMNDLKFALNCTKSVKTLSQQERLAKRQRSLIRLSSSQRSQSQSESQSQSQMLQQQQGFNDAYNTPIRAQPRSRSQLVCSTRKPMVGFSTSEECDLLTPTKDTARLNPQRNSNQHHVANPNFNLNQIWNHQQEQQPRGRTQAASMLASMLLQRQHKQPHQCHLPDRARSQTSQHQKVNHKNNGHLQHATSFQQQNPHHGYLRNSHRNNKQQQEPIVFVNQWRPQSAAANDTTSQRRQLFAQQTVDTIDDELVWQQN